MNKINEVRAQIETIFNPALIVPSEHSFEESHSGNYSLEVDIYGVDKSHGNWAISTAKITDLRTGDTVAEIKRNDDRFFHCWIERNGSEYLLCSEDLEGQTVIDLTHRMVASHSCEDDPFIWTEFYPSPSKRKLAISGCNWACPYEISVYDFGEPLNLPLKRIKEGPFLGDFVEWVSDDAFSTRGKDGIIQIHDIAT